MFKKPAAIFGPRSLNPLTTFGGKDSFTLPTPVANFFAFSRHRAKKSGMRFLTRILCASALLVSVAFAESLSETRKKAKKGDADAQRKLGWM